MDTVTEVASILPMIIGEEDLYFCSFLFPEMLQNASMVECYKDLVYFWLEWFMGCSGSSNLN